MNDQKEQAVLQQMLDLTSELNKESDRAAAILAAAYLDRLLKDLLIVIMIEDSAEVHALLGHADTPLGTFSSRIRAAYCLNLISRDEFRDLNLIRRIRNDFAHQLTGLSFEVSPIVDRCRELQGAQVGSLPNTARERFTKASVRLMVDIILRTKSHVRGGRDSDG